MFRELAWVTARAVALPEPRIGATPPSLPIVLTGERKASPIGLSMNTTLDQFNRMKPGEFAHWMGSTDQLSAPSQPFLQQLTASGVRASYQFASRPTDGVLAAVAHDLATLLVKASQPDAVAWTKKELTVQFIAAPLSGEINAESAPQLIDWAQPGDQAVAINGFNGNGTQVFTARLTVCVVQQVVAPKMSAQ